MPLTPGDILGPYRIEALLGVGGMGEVYRAHDPRLGRDAALKVIAPRLLGNASLQRRFQTEARAASALNHPSIVTVYDVGEDGGVSWIAMEWVEGRTLREVLSTGAMQTSQVLAVARQIASGLATAHARGVVHRDLKPENIMVGEDGRAKILDFGLARHTPIDALQNSDAEAATIPGHAGAATFEGAILGTVGYMSPEQAAGRPVDLRSDQFAFGLLVYEMLSGQRAFERSSTIQTLAAIIQDEPVPLSTIRSGVPGPLLRLVERCLSKSPEGRFISTREIATALESIDAGTSSRRGSEADAVTVMLDSTAVSQTTLARPARRRAVLMLAAVVVMTLSGLIWYRFQSAPRAIESLAVLPFETAIDDPDADYLGDGLTESLIDQMSRVESLRVMARSTVARFKRTTDPQKAGKQLGVGAVLVGSVSRRDRQLIISAELIDSSSGARLWGQKYDRPITDLMRVQDSIALEIVDGLRLEISPKEAKSVIAHPTKSAEAYELFLKARFLLQYDTEEDDLEARRLYLEAIKKDPEFVDAYQGVGALYTRAAGNGYAPPAESWLRAADYAGKTLELDPGNFSARVALAVRHFHYDWDWPLAEREFRELSTDPRLFLRTYYQPAAMFFWATGRPAQSVSLMETGLRLDPENSESRVMLADLLAEAGRSAESVSHYRAIVAAEPDDPRAHYGLANVLRRQGQADQAIAMLRKAYELAGEQSGTDALVGARTQKDYDDAELVVARHRLEQLAELATRRYVSPGDMARLHARVGDRDAAFAALKLALAERSPGLVFLKVDRAWDRIREDPRFPEIVRQVGIR